MKIALVGYGKMGQQIEQIATERGHEIVLKITSDNRQDLTPENLQKADVAIEMTHPGAAKENVLFCLDAGTKVVSGTTGWNEDLHLAQNKAKEKGSAFLHASNFSVGVNIFFEVNKLLARLMNEQPNYEISMSEIHHLQKKDSPSGTAITLATQIMDNVARKTKWSEEEKSPETIFIDAQREEGVPGTHGITYSSSIDTIDIKHTAHNRTGFALGAVLAAEYISNKEGVFTMKDVLGINS